LKEVDQFLDQASRSSAPELRIIHGVGTGALRSAIRNHLARHPMVNSFRPEEGPSDGVTMIEVA
jgi:DNA mismatch repair protein MutS2